MFDRAKLKAVIQVLLVSISAVLLVALLIAV
jgi:hypothetical protein